MGFHLPCVTVNSNAGMLQGQAPKHRVCRNVHQQALPNHQRGDSPTGVLISRHPHESGRQTYGSPPGHVERAADQKHYEQGKQNGMRHNTDAVSFPDRSRRQDPR